MSPEVRPAPSLALGGYLDHVERPAGVPARAAAESSDEDEALRKAVWRKFRGCQFGLDDGYGRAFKKWAMAKLGRRTTSGVATVKTLDRSALATAGLRTLTSLVGADALWPRGADVPNIEPDASEIADVDAVELVVGELRVNVLDFVADLGIGCIPGLQQLMGVKGIVVEGYKAARTTVAIDDATTTHAILRPSAARNLGVAGLLETLNAKRDKHLFRIGTYVIDAVVPLPSSGATLVRFAYKVWHAVAQHQMMQEVNGVLDDESLDPPDDFTLDVLDNCPLMGCHLFIGPGTSQMFGLTPIELPDDEELSRKAVEAMDKTLGKVKLDEQRKAYAKHLQDAALDRVRASPYKLMVKEGEGAQATWRVPTYQKDWWQTKLAARPLSRKAR